MKPLKVFLVLLLAGSVLAFEEVGPLLFAKTDVQFSEGLESKQVLVNASSFCPDLIANFKRTENGVNKFKIEYLTKYCEEVYQKDLFQKVKSVCKPVNRELTRFKRDPVTAVFAVGALALSIYAILKSEYDGQKNVKLIENQNELLKALVQNSDFQDHIQKMKKAMVSVNAHNFEVKEKVPKDFGDFFSLNDTEISGWHFDSCTFDWSSSVLKFQFKKPKILNNFQLLIASPFEIQHSPCPLLYHGPKHLVYDSDTKSYCEYEFDPLSTKRILPVPFCQFKPSNELYNFKPKCIENYQPKTFVQILDENYFIYCYSKKIEINELTHDCPNYAFKLPLRSNFKINNHTFSFELHQVKTTIFPHFVNHLKVFDLEPHLKFRASVLKAMEDVENRFRNFCVETWQKFWALFGLKWLYILLAWITIVVAIYIAVLVYLKKSTKGNKIIIQSPYITNKPLNAV